MFCLPAGGIVDDSSALCRSLILYSACLTPGRCAVLYNSCPPLEPIFKPLFSFSRPPGISANYYRFGT